MGRKVVSMGGQFKYEAGCMLVLYSPELLQGLLELTSVDRTRVVPIEMPEDILPVLDVFP